MKNPLLDCSELPRFDLIRPEHVAPGIRELLEDLGDELQALEAAAKPTWRGLVEPIERISERLGFSWGIAGHLMSVQNSDELREAYESVQSEVVAFSMRFSQSREVYEGLKRLAGGADWDELDVTQRRIVELLVRDAELSGVGLEGEARERFNAIQTELAELGTRFSNHVLDSTKNFALVVESSAEVKGMPESLLELAAQNARDADRSLEATAESGPWRFTLDAPCWIPYMQHCRDRGQRERMYRAFLTRASEGSRDNTPLISRFLALRHEEAQLLGYRSYVELSLASKMAPDVAAVDRLLEQLLEVSFPAAQRELDELRQFARATGEQVELEHWDIPFWAERMREERFAYRDEDLRPYFPLDRVLEGLFRLARRLFGIEVVPADGETPGWHPDVRFFHVRSGSGERIASFYLDAYSRPSEKRGGAWMNECVGRTGLGGVLKLPVAYLICNQTPPVESKPSLMTFREVETLFHEFGHCLQHMLTTVDYGLAAGIRNVDWDAVELASQFMENWCYDRDTLLGLSGHFTPGERLPEELFTKICAARTYRAGSMMLRQLSFSMLDLELYGGHERGDGESPFELQQRIAERTAVLAPLPEDRFLCCFEHIFPGGYAAGYYSYKWAEVLSADAFAAFEECGLEDEAAVAETGRRYRDTVLALGGSRPPMDVFTKFRGREPTTDALLRHSGL